MQIPCMDYTEKFSPVATDASIRIVIALILFFWDSKGWRARGVDREAVNGVQICYNIHYKFLAS